MSACIVCDGSNARVVAEPNGGTSSSCTDCSIVVAPGLPGGYKVKDIAKARACLIRGRHYDSLSTYGLLSKKEFFKLAGVVATSENDFDAKFDAIFKKTEEEE